MDTPLLPTPFSRSNLWAICLKDQRGGGLMERWVLADPNTDGLNVLRRTYPASANHSLWMAFSLDQLEHLEAHLQESEAEEGALHSQAILPQHHRPAWASSEPGSFLVFQATSDATRAHWIRAVSRGHALLAAKEASPQDVAITVGDLEAFSEQIQKMREAVETQNFGLLFTDLRRQVKHPASRAQISAYPLAKAGLFSTPEEAMAAHQKIFLEDLSEENWSE